MDVGAPRGWGRVSTLLAVALLIAGCAASGKKQSAQTHRAAPGTVTKTFAAYDAAGNLAVNVHDIERGSCWTTSVSAPVANAYRCIAGNDILDPCFAPPKAAAGAPATQVACVAAPWAQAEVLQLSKPLPAGSPAGDPRAAWAFLLANGVRCVSSTGMVPEVAGVNLDYHCSDQSNAALLDPTAHQVSAQDAAPSAGTLRRVSVRTIWRG
jgi:hypothetical protein